MPRKPYPCADCGTPLSWGKGSLPEGQARCRPCRRAASALNREMCSVCGVEPCSTTSSKTCGAAVCKADCRSAATSKGNVARNPVPLLCAGGCGVSLSRKAGRRYCDACRSIGGVTHIACAVRVIDCAHCGAPVVCGPRQQQRKFCNDKVCCNDRARLAMNAGYQRYKPRLIEAAHRRRAQVIEQYVEDVSIDYLILRDKGRCHLCGIKVKLDGKRGPLMPSIDHVVPISKGGEHSLANTRLSHYRCNLSKGNRGGGEQLALVG